MSIPYMADPVIDMVDDAITGSDNLMLIENFSLNHDTLIH